MLKPKYLIHIQGSDFVSGSVANGMFQVYIHEDVPFGDYGIEIKSFAIKNYKFKDGDNTGFIKVVSNSFVQVNTYDSNNFGPTQILGVYESVANTNFGGSYETFINNRLKGDSFFNVVKGMKNLNNSLINIQIVDYSNNPINFTGVDPQFQNYDLILAIHKL